jgi:hypothetical protein
MNDEEMIWEAYQKNQKPKISPIKQVFLDYFKGIVNCQAMYDAFIHTWSKKFPSYNSQWEEKLPDPTPEQEKLAIIFFTEYGHSGKGSYYADENGDITYKYESFANEVKENMNNNIFYDSINMLKGLGISEDRADQMLRKLPDDTYPIELGIEQIMNMDI